MRLKLVELENFRNYARLAVDTDHDLVFLVGENASGKTNFIESIYFLAYLKSFRAPDNLLVNSNEDYFKVSGQADETRMEAVVQVNPVMRRGFKLDDQKIKKVLWQTYRAVLFVPNDLNLFILGPAARRKYLNETLAQINPAYAADVVSLEHILKQRSALLGEIAVGRATRDQLDFWDTQLAQTSVRVSQARRDFLSFIDDRFVQTYSRLTGFLSGFKIEYKGLPQEFDESMFLSKLREYQDAEIRSGQNLFGAHRDDFNIIKDGALNIYNSSRGELRAQILTIKLLQAEYLTVGANKPIILLDDVFSELDQLRRELLLKSLTGHQIFITATDDHDALKISSDAKILRTGQNQIK